VIRFVANLNIGYTLIRTGDDNMIVVPNSVMVGQAILKSAE